MEGPKKNPGVIKSGFKKPFEPVEIRIFTINEIPYIPLANFATLIDSSPGSISKCVEGIDIDDITPGVKWNNTVKKVYKVSDLSEIIQKFLGWPEDKAGAAVLQIYVAKVKMSTDKKRPNSPVKKLIKPDNKRSKKDQDVLLKKVIEDTTNLNVAQFNISFQEYKKEMEQMMDDKIGESKKEMEQTMNDKIKESKKNPFSFN